MYNFKLKRLWRTTWILPKSDSIFGFLFLDFFLVKFTEQLLTLIRLNLVSLFTPLSISLIQLCRTEYQCLCKTYFKHSDVILGLVTCLSSTLFGNVANKLSKLVA